MSKRRRTKAPLDPESTQEKKRLLRDFSVHSSILFVMTAIISYLTAQFFSVMVARHYGIPCTIYHSHIYFTHNNELWLAMGQAKIINLFSAGPVISIIAGMIYTLFYFQFRRKKGFIKLFFLWMVINSFNMGFGAIATGLITNTKFWGVALWLQWDKSPIIVMFIISISLFFMVLLGIFLTKPLLKTAVSKKLIETKKDKQKLVYSGFILPWFFGSILLFLFRIDGLIPEMNLKFAEYIMHIPIAILLTTYFLNVNKIKKRRIVLVREKNQTGINNVLLIIGIVIFIAYRVLLDGGIVIVPE